MPFPRAEEADDEESSADDDMEPVEPGRHIKSRAVNAAGDRERGVTVFVCLHTGEQQAEDNGDAQALNQTVAITFPKRVMRPGYRCAGQQQDKRIHKRQIKGIESFHSCRGPDTARETSRQDVMRQFLGIEARFKKCPEECNEKFNKQIEEGIENNVCEYMTIKDVE